MENDELSQSSVIKAFALLQLQTKDNHSKPQLVSAQSQEKEFEKVEPTTSTKSISNEPKLKLVQGRGRRLGQDFTGLNKSNNSKSLQELESFQKDYFTKSSLNMNSFNSGLVNVSQFDYQSFQSQGRGRILPSVSSSDLVNVSQFELQSVQSQGRGRILPSENNNAFTGENVLNEPKTQSRGRGVRKVLENVNQSYTSPEAMKINLNANKSVQIDLKELSKDVTPSPSKNAISNAVLFTSNSIFEYTINFQPDVNSETRRFGFLNKHFLKLGKTFLYNRVSIFVPNLLENHELTYTLSNRSTADLFTMTLKFNRKLNIKEQPKLLSVLFDQANKSAQNSIYVPDTQMKIIPYFVTAIRETKKGTVVCLDYQYYLIQEKNIAEIMLELEERYQERFHEAMDALLTKVPIFYTQDNKIYKMLKVEWEKQLLVLEKNGFQRTAKPKDCNTAEIVCDISLYHPQTPKEFMSKIQELFSSQLLKNDWNIRFDNFTKPKARVLKPETIIFGDGVNYTPKDGNWEVNIRENEVFIPTELWSWMIFYTPTDAGSAHKLSNNIQELRDDTGVSIGKPLFYEFVDTKTGYVNALNEIICKELQLIVVIIPESPNKPEALIKYICCISKPIPYQIVHASDIEDPLKIHEITLQLNLMLGGIPWTINLSYQNWMICGIDLHCAFDNRTLPVCSFVTALTTDATQWYSRAIFVEHDFEKCFKEWLEDTLKKYKGTNGIFPSQLLVYQNCTEDTHYQFFKDYKNFNFNECLMQLKIKNMEICIILVQRDTHISFYKDLKSGVANVPPGTVVDDTITNIHTRDFILTSHYVSNNNIARPTYYEIIKDTCGLSSDQLQLITYKMCHLYYKHAKTVEVPAPCLYAEKLGILVTEDIRGIPSPNLDECLHYL